MDNSSCRDATPTLAFKWIRFLFRRWKNREADDEAKYLEVLHRKLSFPVKRLSAGIDVQEKV
jgi:hypothetical protein